MPVEEDDDKNLYRITIRLNDKEYRLTKALSKYLEKNGLIERGSINNTVRYAISYLGYVISQSARQQASEITNDNEV